jgi:DnaK suppressor protein
MFHLHFFGGKAEVPGEKRVIRPKGRATSRTGLPKADAKPFRGDLLRLRARLRGDVSAMARAALNEGGPNDFGPLSAIPSHIADMGTDTFEQDNTLRLMDTEGEVLQQVEAALERIDEGTYGLCSECGHKIPKLRLKAIPYTPYCVKCASQMESGVSD